jgi:hypothetical protein
LIGTLSVQANSPLSSNYNFAAAVSTLPASFGTYNSGVATNSTFRIDLNAKYTPSNLPIFNVTGYIYSASAGYIDVQRQFGSTSSPSLITVNAAVTTLTFSSITNSNFPATGNDNGGLGYGLYIQFQILN